MKTIKNPIELVVRFTEVGSDVVRVTVESSLRFVPSDHRNLVYDVVTKLVGRSVPYHYLYDGSALLCGDKEFPSPTCNVVPLDDRVLSIEPREYELPDGSVRNISFTLEHKFTDIRRDYVISGVRVVRLLGDVSIKSGDCNEEEEC